MDLRFSSFTENQRDRIVKYAKDTDGCEMYICERCPFFRLKTVTNGRWCVLQDVINLDNGFKRIHDVCKDILNNELVHILGSGR